MTKPIEWKCQFCGWRSPRREWIERGNQCPECRRQYDPILAADGDDEP